MARKRPARLRRAAEIPTGQRFPRSIRLRRSSEYRRVQSRGRRLRTRHLLVLYTPGRAGPSRFGLVVSRKVGNAVNRNRVKRWLRESLRRRRADLRGSWDLAIIPNRAATTAGYETLDGEIGQIFERLSDMDRRRSGR